LDSSIPDNYDKVALSAPDYGVDRIFASDSSITKMGLETDFPFTNNTWYRMVISGSMTQEVRASIYNDAATVELIGVNLGHNLSAYTSGFRIGLSQSMASPGSPFPTDVAIDWVRLTAGQNVTTITIDIKPGSFPNGINPRSKGVIPVAILTSEASRASSVDPSTLHFGRTGSEAAPLHSSPEDVDKDGDIDLVLHFDTQQTGLQCGDSSVHLTGKTFDGQQIEGSEPIRAVGCK
jgi:hypothetical protein